MTNGGVIGGFWLLAAAGVLAATPLAAQERSVQARTQAGCADGLVVDIDRESFADRGGATGPPPTGEAVLETYRRLGGLRFKAAANRLCADGQLPPGALARFRRLLVQRGEGAAEAAVYVDPEVSGPDTVILQQFFMDGVVPEQDDIAQGILCWYRPDTPVCAEREP